MGNARGVRVSGGVLKPTPRADFSGHPRHYWVSTACTANPVVVSVSAVYEQSSVACGTSTVDGSFYFVGSVDNLSKVPIIYAFRGGRHILYHTIKTCQP